MERISSHSKGSIISFLCLLDEGWDVQKPLEDRAGMVSLPDFPRWGKAASSVHTIPSPFVDKVRQDGIIG
jgi:hypothetical protein